jgi:lysophospholipase L1-like esterase
MKRLSLIICLTSWIILFSCQQKERFYEADNSSILYTGRVDFTNPKRPVFMYSGVSIRSAFEGTSAYMILKDDSAKNRFNIRIDSTDFIIKTNKNDSVYLIADHLKNAVHNIVITRITEWHGGNTTFLGFRIAGKGLIPVFPRKYKIEFIGNSITCGYGSEGKSHNEHFTYTTENCLKTYAAYTSENLNADFILVCRSGIGMHQSYGGDTTFAMPLLYEEVVAGSPMKWEFKKFVPDVVFIELGANDLSSNVDSSAFTMAYLKFLDRIRGYYPDARLVCASGPGGLNDEKGNQKWQNLITGVVGEASKKMNNLYYYRFEPTEHNGSDWHPSAGEHKMLSVALTDYLRNLMNWK